MKERKLSVPICVRTKDEIGQDVEFLRRAGAKRVFLCGVPGFAEKEVLLQKAEIFRAYVERLSEEGFEVGLWTHCFGCGVLSEEALEFGKKFTRLRDIRGKVCGAFCPTSEDFCQYMETVVEVLASLPASMLMFDDDLVQSVRPGIGCACDAHLEMFRREIGDASFSLEDCREKLFYSPDKTLRRKWFDLQGKTLLDFARRMRAAVDRVNPEMRLGFCASYTSWDFEGVSAIELAKALAGNTKPFLRTSGAPYWVRTNRHGLNLSLQDIVEMTRCQREWAEDSGVEIFDENDNYPRIPAFVPTGYQEGFDLAMAVDGGVPPFKYLFSYVDDISKLTEYYNAHMHNRDAAAWLTAAADGKHDVGMRVREYRDKARGYDFDPKLEAVFGECKAQMGISYPRSHCIATRNAIPTVYGKANAEIIVGENAKYIPLDELPRGAILDVRAAEILQARGVDVGLSSVEPYYAEGGVQEILNGIIRPLWVTNQFGCVTLKNGAEELSRFRHGKLEFPASYRYENADGKRFLVYCFDFNSLRFDAVLFSHTDRRTQLNAQLDWLGADVPVRVESDAPNLYAMCKRGTDGSLLAVFFNFMAGELYDLKVRSVEGLVGKTLRTLNCSAKADGDVLVIDRIGAFGFAAIEIKA